MTTEAKTDITNQCGRFKFAAHSDVRLLMLDGTISAEVYTIPPRDDVDFTRDPANVQSDSKGIVTVISTASGQQLRVNQRRIIPIETTGHAIVLESGDRYRAVCPKCKTVHEVTPHFNELKCTDECGTFPLYWYGTKPVATSITERKRQPKKVQEKTKMDKQPKASSEPTKIDLDAIKALPDCELYTKKNVKFDHHDFDVRAHTILYTGTNPRKLCFNTYNGTLGKKQTALPIQEFLSDTPIPNMKRAKPWFALADLEGARKKLADDGFERV